MALMATFFAYDAQGTNLVHPIQPELVGQNLSQLQDERGDFLIQALLSKLNQVVGITNICGANPQVLRLSLNSDIRLGLTTGNG